MASAAPPRHPLVGLMLPTTADADDQRVDPARVVEAARRAEAAGFDGVYVGDHVLHPRPFLESVVTLAAVAASTERMSIGPCVMLVALRQPLVLARQLTTLAAFAPGRLRIGVGVGGEYPAEFEALGVARSERGTRTETAVRQLRALLAGRPMPDLDGGDNPVTIAPADAGDVPFLLAGWKEASLRRAAEYGDGWIGYLLSPDSFARRRSFLLEHRAERRMADAPFTTGMLLPVHLDRHEPGARRRAAAGWSRRTANGASFPDRLFVAGPPDAVVDGLHQYWEAGCTELVLAPVDQGPGYLDQLDRLVADVLPQVRSFGSALRHGGQPNA